MSLLFVLFWCFSSQTLSARGDGPEACSFVAALGSYYALFSPRVCQFEFTIMLFSSTPQSEYLS
ncbi:hypothetical protein L9F63_027363, partial [Diploptera punctata]